MLSLEQKIIAKINAEAPAFVTVGNASLLAGLREIGPLLPGCFVFPGKGSPVQGSLQGSTTALEDQEWRIVIVVAHQAHDSADGQTEDIAGNLMQAVLKSLQGQRIDDNQKRGFSYQGRANPSYNLGYAEFPMIFSAQIVIGN